MIGDQVQIQLACQQRSCVRDRASASAGGTGRYKVILPRSRMRGDSCIPSRSNSAKFTRVTPWVSVACSVIGRSVALPRISSRS